MKVTYHSQVGIITNSSTELFVIKEPPTNLRAILDGLVQLHNMIRGTSLRFDDVFREPQIYDRETFDKDIFDGARLREKYGETFFWGYEKEGNVGATMIHGATDNSIPYWMCEVLEEIKGITRTHLG